MGSPEVTGSSASGETEKCPRCGSQNTKFCYYNNYNSAQPRHFCKSCRRYWTVGGSLRNVPVGGSTRRATVHSQSTAAPLRRRPVAAASYMPPSCSSSSPSIAEPPPPEPDHLDAVRCFETLLAEPLPAGFLALADPFPGEHDGFSLGLGLGHMDEISVPAWAFYGDDGSAEQDVAWPVAGDNGGGCFGWPELAIRKDTR